MKTVCDYNSPAAAGAFKKGGIAIMRKRTLVYMIFREDYVGLRTVSRSPKSPHRFYISRHKLEELGTESTALVLDIGTASLA